MKLAEVHDQVSPEDETCDMCVQEGRTFTKIHAYTDYHMVVTTDDIFMDLCDTHYYEIATLQ